MSEELKQGQFRKKPMVVEAWQINFHNRPFPNWVDGAFRANGLKWCSTGDGVYVITLEGVMFGNIGDMLIQGVKGELYPCKLEIFDATYEPVGAVTESEPPYCAPNRFTEPTQQ